MRKLRIMSYLFLATFLLFGCNEILVEVEPATSLPGEVVLNSPEGVEALRASMYSKIRASYAFTTAYFIGPGAYTDETRNRPGSTRFQGLNLARDGDGSTQHPMHTTTGGGAGPVGWTSAYNIIQDANLLIGAVPDGVLPAETMSRYRGEAYAIRAWVMHSLVRALGYEPGRFVGGWDLGIVIRTEPVLDVADADLRPRSTVGEVYTQIFSDLAQAKTLLSGVAAPNSFPTEALVDAISARVNLYAGNWDAALTAATNAINNSGRFLQTTEDGVAGMFHENVGNHPEAIFKLVVNADTEPIAGSNINNGPAAFTSNQWVPQIPTNMVIDLYDPDDYRLGWYGDCVANQTHGATAVRCDEVNDEGWSITKFNGRKGNLADDLPYFRVAEMVLIQAEAAAKAGGSPNAGAPYLNALRNARGLDDVPAAALASLEAFEDEILDERVRELIVEGHRFYDLKRLGRDVRNPDGSLKFRSDSHRMLSAVGGSHTGVNPLLVENPGY